jgi:hypothetical protein
MGSTGIGDPQRSLAALRASDGGFRIAPQHYFRVDPTSTLRLNFSGHLSMTPDLTILSANS